MKILAIEPYYKGSHKAWLDQYSLNSGHQIKILSLPGKHWKWRMHGASIELASQFNQLDNYHPDLILFTDMMDVNLFLSLTRKDSALTKTILYFHENQFAYPKSIFDQDKISNRDDHYGFINFTGGLCVDHIFFNSQYNRNSYLEGCKKLVEKMPDFNSMENIQLLHQKSEVLRLGLSLKEITPRQHIKKVKEQVILWNHRWEYDKNPESFFNVLKKLKDEKINFKLNLIGPRNNQAPAIFNKYLKYFENEIIHSHKVEKKEEYLNIISQSDILPITSNQEFFGISAAEGICAGAMPLFPNRLSLPELIPIDLHDRFLYIDEDDLLKKLKDYIGNPSLFTEDQTCKNKLIQHCQQYDWSYMAKIYDEKFFNLVDK
jgi:glycosyltransferase involved in cell wall biosynthesis